MPSTSIRNKVHDLINEADDKLLEAVYKLLEIYKENNSSPLSVSQKREVINRSGLYKSGKIKGYTITEAKKILKSKRVS